MNPLRQKRTYRSWTAQEQEIFMRLYPDHDNSYIAEILHKSTCSISNRAVKYGLYKSPEYVKKVRERTRFKPGHKPKNKGVPIKYWMSTEGIEKFLGHRMRGRKDKQVGYESTKNGYVCVKVEHGKKMVLKHRWIYEQAHGPIPKGHIVIFKDGNVTNFDLCNLECISRGENMRRNNRLSPQKHAERMEKIRQSRLKLFEADRIRLRWGIEPKSKLVKRPDK